MAELLVLKMEMEIYTEIVSKQLEQADIPHLTPIFGMFIIKYLTHTELSKESEHKINSPYPTSDTNFQIRQNVHHYFFRNKHTLHIIA